MSIDGISWMPQRWGDTLRANRDRAPGNCNRLFAILAVVEQPLTMAWQREVSFWKRYVAAVAATVITHLIIWLSRIERAILPAATELLFDKDDARSLRGVTAFHQNQHLVWQGLPSFNLAR